MKKTILILACGMSFLTGFSQELPKWANKAKKAVFSVITYNKDNQILNTGNGFYIDEARLNLAKWYNEVEKFDYMEFNKVLDTFSNHSTTIINYFEERLTNASAESFNATIKAFRSQLRGVANVKFFMFRLARLYA